MFQIPLMCGVMKSLGEAMPNPNTIQNGVMMPKSMASKPLRFNTPILRKPSKKAGMSTRKL